MASVNPFSPKFVSSRLNVVTIVINPKSRGVRSRAKTIVEMIWMARPKAEEPNVALAPRRANPATWSASTLERNAPLASKGFKRPPDVTRHRIHRQLVAETEPCHGL